MPRGPRLDAPGALHHVMARGIERGRILRIGTDYEDFTLRLEGIVQAHRLAIYAWALLPNHLHLLVRTGPRPLPSAMRKLLTGYAVSFNKRHRRHGHVFQNRYKSIVCEAEAYLLELTRYIHLNPYRAKLVRDLEELDTYPWCGHSALMGEVERPWQRVEDILAMFGGGTSEARARYGAFVADGLAMGKRPELTGGGLVRSAGGWSEVLALRRRDERMAYDSRVLGSGEFVEHLLAEAEQRQVETLRLRARGWKLDEIIGEVAQEHGIEVGELIGGSRRRPAVHAREDVAQIAVRVLGMSGAEVARRLGVTTSCINRTLATRKTRPTAERIAAKIRE